MTGKQKREMQLFRLFRQSSGLALSGSLRQPDPPEPDIVVAGSANVLGIEVTRVYVGPKQRAREGEQEWLVNRAASIHAASGLAHVVFRVYWSQWKPVLKKDRGMAKEIAAIIAANMPSLGGRSLLDREDGTGDDLLIQIDRLEIDQLIQYQFTEGCSPRSAFVDSCSPDLIQGEIDKKNAKYAHYQGSCDSVWLLLALEGSAPSSWCDIEEDLIAEEYVSVFSRAFLLDVLRRKTYELSTRPP